MDLMLRRKIRWIGTFLFATLLVLTQAVSWAASVAKTETIKTFATGKLCKVLYSDNKVQDVIYFNNGTMEVYNPEKHGALLVKEKIASRLQKALDSADQKGLFQVAVWTTDIDQSKIESYVKDKLKITDLKKESAERIQLYAKEKRAKAKEEYTAKNEKFLKSYLDSTEETTIFTSSYAPFIVAKLTKQKIEKLLKDDTVAAIDLFIDSKKADELAYSVPNINAKYTRDTLNLKGSGVKVGIVESGYPDKSNAQLSGQAIFFDISDSEAQSRLSSHATMVGSVIVGKTQGIAPSASLYAVAALSRLQDYQKIEWLIDQGVLVINYSAGYTDTVGEYSDMAKWIDHLGNQHLVHFVKSSGNVRLSNYAITDPGMAYNAFTVGSSYDHDSANEPYWPDDTFSTFSRYTETSGGYKPDLTAPGESITVAGYTNQSGTSLSAPHASAVLTQLLGYRANLITNNALLKAICTAGTTHKTATDYGTYSLSPYYSNKEGAGVIDAKAAYTIAANSSYSALTLTAAQFPYSTTFTVAAANKPVRVSLTWLKQNSITATSHPGAAVTERDLSDLDLEVYGPGGAFMASSISAVNNVEVVQFTPSVAGTYTIQVIGCAVQNDSELVSLAWYQQP